MTRRCRAVNILVRYRCNWSRSSILVSRSQLLMFLTVPGKCVFPLSSSLCCEVEFWTSWSHDSTWNLKTPKSAITRFAPPTVVVSWVWVTRPEWTQYSIHHHKSFIFRVHDVPRVLFEDGFHFWWSLHGSLFLHIWRKKDVTEEEKRLTLLVFYRGFKSHKIVLF